jgi:hypothetical protein
MDVQLAEERILVLADQFNMDHAEGKASARKVDAFGTMARVAGFLSKPKDDEFELIYKERRLQPFWRLTCRTASAYERRREHVLKVAPEVREATIEGQTHAVTNQQVSISVMESCREDSHKEVLYDAITGQPAPDLSTRMKFPADVATEESLKALATAGTVIVPPQAKSSVVVREVLASLINKIQADKVLEESVVFEAIDLCYRPVYAFRYRRQGKEAVVEFDGLTGEARPGGATFETYLGKILEPQFLLDAGAEAANIFFPGATLVKVVVAKGMEMSRQKTGA